MSIKKIESLLDEIRSDEIQTVYEAVTFKAAEWAVAGFINEANYLLEQLWKFGLAHSDNLNMLDNGFIVLWHVSNKQPASIPFKMEDIQAIEKENWNSIFYPSWDNPYTTRFMLKPMHELIGEELLIKAVLSVNRQPENGEALPALEKYMETEDPAGYNYFLATTSGSLLGARDNEVNPTHFIKKWGEGYIKYSENYNLASLMCNRATAQYLLNGVLTAVFNLTSDQCREESKQIINALEERFTKGRSLVYAHLNWEELLEKISSIAIEQRTIDIPRRALAKKSLTSKPSSETAIVVIERKLNFRLPDDYRSFLFTSNGFPAFSSTGVTLLPIEDVDFLLNVDEELIDAWAMGFYEGDPLIARLRSAIIIGGIDEEQQLFLIPLSDNKWECWFFSAWGGGETIYPSFRYYMEAELQRLEAIN